MEFPEILYEKLEKFLAPSACLVFEVLFKVFPSLSVTTRAVCLVDPSGKREDVLLGTGERFTVLGYGGKRGAQRTIILMTSRGVGCCKLLDGFI